MGWSSVGFNDSVKFDEFARGKLQPAAASYRHFLYSGNVAGASSKWPLEFVATQDQVLIVDVSRLNCGTAIAKLDHPARADEQYTATGFSRAGSSWMDRRINYLRVGLLNGKEVVGVVCEDGAAILWSIEVISLILNRLSQSELEPIPVLDTKPLFVAESTSSAWGLAFHPSLPLIAVSDNSHSITVHTVAKPQQSRSSKLSHLGGNVPCVEFVTPAVKLMDAAPALGQQAVYISFTTLSLISESGTTGMWTLRFGEIGNNRYAGSMVFHRKLDQWGWATRGVDRRRFLQVSSSFALCGDSQASIECDILAAELASVTVGSGHERVVRGGRGERRAERLLSRSSEPSWLYAQRQRSDTQLKKWRRRPSNDFLDAGAGSPLKSQRIKRSRGIKQEVELGDLLIVTTTNSQAFLCRASDYFCHAAALTTIPTDDSTGEMAVASAMTIVEVIEPLSLCLAVTRTGTLIVLRFTEYGTVTGMRQEATFDEEEHPVLVGLTVRPAAPDAKQWIVRAYYLGGLIIAWMVS